MNKIKIFKGSKTLSLFPRRGFIIGMGNSINLGGEFYKYNSSENGTIADCKATYSDWLTIGNDIRDSASQIRKKKVELTRK